MPSILVLEKAYGFIVNLQHGRKIMSISNPTCEYRPGHEKLKMNSGIEVQIADENVMYFMMLRQATTMI